MKFSTEAIVAAAIALVFAVLCLGAIAREQGDRGPVRGKWFVATSNASLSPVIANEVDILGFY